MAWFNVAHLSQQTSLIHTLAIPNHSSVAFSHGLNPMSYAQAMRHDIFRSFQPVKEINQPFSLKYRVPPSDPRHSHLSTLQNSELCLGMICHEGLDWGDINGFVSMLVPSALTRYASTQRNNVQCLAILSQCLCIGKTHAPRKCKRNRSWWSIWGSNPGPWRY